MSAVDATASENSKSGILSSDFNLTSDALKWLGIGAAAAFALAVGLPAMTLNPLDLPFLGQ